MNKTIDKNKIKSWIKITVPSLLEKHSVPGAAVAVFIDGEVVFQHAASDAFILLQFQCNHIF